jgi:DNA-binding winged helix-turn-helix (wHTH) protein
MKLVDTNQAAGRPTSGTGAGTVFGSEPEVAVLEWPARQQDRAELARWGVPRLLLVAAENAPPHCIDCLEDWVRLPASEIDLRARLLALAARHPAHTRATLDQYGVLRRAGALVFLPPFEQALAQILIDNLGEVVPTAAIERWLDDELDVHSLALRVHLSRLRKRIAPLNLNISCIRNVGYMMRADVSAAAAVRHAGEERSDDSGRP